MFTLVIGGARSGKSRFAQSLCAERESVAYIATARVEDDEMRARVERHRNERPTHWLTIEEPLDLAKAMRQARTHAKIVLVDCLTVWLSNLMWGRRAQSPEEQEAAVYAGVESLAAAAAGIEVVAVSNEVGFSLVPESPVGRQFRDLQGFLNQRAAAMADRVFLTVAGIAIPIKNNIQKCRR